MLKRLASILILCAVIISPTLLGAATMSLTLDNVPLRKVLQMIADQNGLNLVLAGEIDGNVSVKLDKVDLWTALDAVLTASGYSYHMSDNVVIVGATGADQFGALESKVFRLKYIDAASAKLAVEPRLSPKGKVVVLTPAAEGSSESNYQANRMVVTDLSPVLNDIAAVVADIDQPERSVMIECKIIETTLDTKSKLGFLWPSSYSMSINGAAGSSSQSSTTTSAAQNAASYDFNTGDWNWGKLSVAQVQMVLDLLEQDGNSRLLSNPKLTATENHESEIQSATVIPIQTINRFTEGASTSDIVSFEDKEVGISLRVTPRISEDGTITLDVHPKVEDIVGFTGPTNNQKPITTSRSVRTRISVKSGESVIIGGLIKESDILREQRVPLLGHIPLLGKLLFTNRSKEKSTTDLLILITPTLVKQ